MNGKSLIITDPIYQPKIGRGIISRIALQCINDIRDLPFIYLLLRLTLIVLPLAVYLFIPGCFNWWLAFGYLTLVLGLFLGPFILMQHNICHRTLFKPQFAWMHNYFIRFAALFFGQTPYSYFAHHIGMHHPENNMQNDLSSTLHYQRDSVIDFIRYLGRFYLLGLIQLSVYFYIKKRRRLFYQTIIGELSTLLLLFGLYCFNWQATLIVFIIPILFARFAMMAGNWAQHAFIDAKDPQNNYRNSITCINNLYNRNCFNDGYHIGHHLKANRHWTEMPLELQKNQHVYAEQGAIVFTKIDFFKIWFLLMTKNYNSLAKCFVNLSNKDLSKREIIQLLRERTQPIKLDHGSR